MLCQQQQKQLSRGFDNSLTIDGASKSTNESIFVSEKHRSMNPPYFRVSPTQFLTSYGRCGLHPGFHPWPLALWPPPPAASTPTPVKRNTGIQATFLTGALARDLLQCFSRRTVFAAQLRLITPSARNISQACTARYAITEERRAQKGILH